MEVDVSQVPTTQQEAQPKTKGVPQIPQQPPVVPQTPLEQTPPTKPKKELKIKKIVIYLIISFALIIAAYIIFIAITYANCSKTIPQACEVDKCNFSLAGFNFAGDIKDDCCGNKRCELGEVYPECMDCPNCDDENKCTSDSYDYNKHKCVNGPIPGVVCCGNTLCEEGYETNLDCPKDCPSCNDNNRLTTDSFNYKTQECENPVTHYFFEDFEEGKTSIDKKENWKIIDDQGDKVLDCTGKEINGVENDWANFGKADWTDYESELNFKLVENYEGFGFHFFSKGEQGYVVEIREGKISLKKTSQQGRKEVSLKPFDFKLDEWYILKTEKKGNNIKVYIDDAIVLEYTDNQPFDTGQLRIETFGDGHVRLDDISIKK